MRSGASSKLPEVVRQLAEAGCDTPRLDAELLLPLGEEAIERRLAREPVAYILGTKGFRWIELEVDRRVLIPRPDTETLVEVALSSGARRIHDVGTGSGAVALALKNEQPDLAVTGSDSSVDAVDVARANADRPIASAAR